MRQWCYVLNSLYPQSSRLQRGDGRLSAGTRTFDEDFNFGYTKFLRFDSTLLGSFLSGKGRAFSRTLKAYRSGRTPTNGITIYIRNGNDRIVEGGADVSYTS